jgi:hypothetical protein
MREDSLAIAVSILSRTNYVFKEPFRKKIAINKVEDSSETLMSLRITKGTGN